MKFNQHPNLEGRHAFMSPSNYHWMNYDVDKLLTVYSNWKAKEKGTELHQIAKECIKHGIRLWDNEQTLNSYVNDAIMFGMSPEVVLYYSDLCWGTADAISFDEKNSLLRIHDLKTGVTPASMWQLYGYQALYCLEYKVKPTEIQSELRIYQNDEVLIDTPEPKVIKDITKKIILFDRELRKVQEG